MGFQFLKNQKKVGKTDKEILKEILAGAFAESDRMQAILRKGKTEKRLKIMSAYGYDLCSKFNGIYLSKDKSTAILYWKKSEFKRSFRDWMNYLSMFLRTVRVSKVFSTLEREKLVESHRLDIPDYIYVWILGSDPTRTSIRGLAEIRDHLNDLSEESGIPVLIETTVEKLLKLYRYVGFEVYDEIFDKTSNVPVWFLKKEVKG